MGRGGGLREDGGAGGWSCSLSPSLQILSNIRTCWWTHDYIHGELPQHRAACLAGGGSESPHEVCCSKNKSCHTQQCLHSIPVLHLPEKDRQLTSCVPWPEDPAQAGSYQSLEKKTELDSNLISIGKQRKPLGFEYQGQRSHNTFPDIPGTAVCQLLYLQKANDKSKLLAVAVKEGSAI